jgi:hypothetical protein
LYSPFNTISEKILLALLRDQERMRERMEQEKAEVLTAMEAVGHQLEAERAERLGKSSSNLFTCSHEE